MENKKWRAKQGRVGEKMVEKYNLIRLSSCFD